jgi:hypothetical protein
MLSRMRIEKATPPTRKSFDWPAVAKTLRSEQGEWFRIAGAPSVSSTDIRRAVVRAFSPAGSFEACHRKGDLYIRFIGEPETPIDEPWLA